MLDVEDVQMVAREMQDELGHDAARSSRSCATNRTRSPVEHARSHAGARAVDAAVSRSAWTASSEPSGAHDRPAAQPAAPGRSVKPRQRRGAASVKRASGLGGAASLCVVGARPNFMKMAPIIARVRGTRRRCRRVLVHTGQHYDDDDERPALRATSGCPRPDVNLEVGSGTHAVQTAEVMRALRAGARRARAGVRRRRRRRELHARLRPGRGQEGRPGRARRGRPAQLRPGDAGGDQPRPDRPDRRPAATRPSAAATTTSRAKASHATRVHFVGNVMIDSLLRHRSRARRRPRRRSRARRHRPSALDGRAGLRRGDAAPAVQRRRRGARSADRSPSCATCRERLPLVFPRAPAHARQHRALRARGASCRTRGSSLLPPQGYLEMLGLMARRTLVLTDSGGIQEETTALGVPCLTMRENTERPITVDAGHQHAGRPRPRARSLPRSTRSSPAGGKRGRVPELWDGHAAPSASPPSGGWLARAARAARACRDERQLTRRCPLGGQSLGRPSGLT